MSNTYIHDKTVAKEKVEKLNLEIEQFDKLKDRIDDLHGAELEQARRDYFKHFDEISTLVEERNQILLNIFASDMNEGGLSSKVIKKHVLNAKGFINDYIIPYRFDYQLDDILRETNSFLTCHIPEKYIGNTKNLIREYATSIRKFYKSLVAHGFIGKDAYKRVSESIADAVTDGGRWHDQFKRDFYENERLLAKQKQG